MGMCAVTHHPDHEDTILAPVMIELTEVCHFKRKPCGRCGKAKTNPIHRKKGGICAFKQQNMCVRCGKARNHRDHLGAPPSFRVLGSGSQRAYIGLKTTWQPILIDLLEQSGLPKGLQRVMVDGEVSYPDSQERDEDNAVALVRKFLGDALVQGGWLSSDVWGRHKFGELVRADEPGVSRLRLTLFPSLEPLD